MVAVHVVLFFLICLILECRVYGQVVISGKVNDSELRTIKYYRPFKDFVNRQLATIDNLESNGSFTLHFSISKPMFIRVVLGREDIDLLCEPGDTIRLELPSDENSAGNGIRIEGNNAEGHAYYNLVYDKIRMQKFDGIREVFENYHHESQEELLPKIETELNRQSVWIDSLFSEGKLTKNYVTYVKAEIHCMLSWETGRLCDKYFGDGADPDAIAKGVMIKKKLFVRMDPLDPIIKSCRSLAGYYLAYFGELYKTKRNGIDKADVIISHGGTQAAALAPEDIQSYLWGYLLYTYRQYAPGMYDYCDVFQQYKTRFPQGPYVEYFDNSDICSKTEKNEVQVINTIDTDLFTFITLKFPHKRLFIDLWATWCAPCKMEFKYYDSLFYAFMREHNVQMVFISIDKPEHKERWMKEIQAISLKGYHVLAEEKLQSSIKEVIYDDQDVAIPRYILVDENGKILSVNFNRPSDSYFKSAIHKLLPH